MSEEEKERMRRLWRSATTPGALAALERMNLDIDIRGVLPSIHVPTLVMNRTDDPVADVDAARDLASHIEGARFVEFAGDMHAFFQGPERRRGGRGDPGVRDRIAPGARRRPRPGDGPVHGHRRFDQAGGGARRSRVARSRRASSRDRAGPARTMAWDRDGHRRGRLLRDVRRAGAGGPMRAGRGRGGPPAGDRDPCRRAHRRGGDDRREGGRDRRDHRSQDLRHPRVPPRSSCPRP